MGGWSLVVDGEGLLIGGGGREEGGLLIGGVVCSVRTTR